MSDVLKSLATILCGTGALGAIGFGILFLTKGGILKAVEQAGVREIEKLRSELASAFEKERHLTENRRERWTVVTSMTDDMVNSKHRALRVPGDNPCKDVRPPERGAGKAKQFLYPSEFLQFVSCERIPMRWRRALAVAVYTYARDGELRELRWDGGDVDLEHGVLSITRAYNQSTKRVEATKTDTRAGSPLSYR